MTVPCAECGAPAALVGGSAVYPHRPDLHEKRFWLCACGAYCGCHGNTETPLGFPAGAEKRRDKVPKKSARSAGYRWLSEQLGIPRAACHIGMMSAADAWRVVALCRGPFTSRSKDPGLRHDNDRHTPRPPR